MLKALQGLLQDEVQARLEAAVDAKGSLSLAAIRSVGLDAAYDPSRLVIAVGVPPQLRRPNVRTLGVSAAPPDAEIMPTSRLSAFLNMRLAQDLRWAHGSQGDAQRQPFRLSLEAAVNMVGWVLEGRGDLTEGPQPGWSRGDLRLVKDNPARAVRWVAGDFTVPSTRFGASRALMGVSVARNFSLDPTRQILPSEAMTFLLERPSKVEVFVNGRLTQTLQLPAGPQDLNGLLLDLGSNEVELVITDDLGAQRRLTKRVGLATDQLAAGVSEFAYSVGFPALPGSAARAPDWSRPTLYLVHREGLRSGLTLGGTLQLDVATQGLSVEPLWATFLGAFSTSAALSHRDGAIGYAAGLRYELHRGGVGDRLVSTFGIGGELRSQAFAMPGELLPTGASYALSASYGQSFGHGLSTRVSAEARAAGPQLARGYAATFSLAKGFRNGLSLMMDATARTTLEQQRELRGRLNFVWAWPDARRSVQAMTDAGSRGSPSGQLSVNQQVNVANATVSATAGVAQETQARRVSESVTYQGQRAELDVSHRLLSPTSPGAQPESIVQTRVGIALVYAGGLFAVSRPVTNSFAIVAPTRTLRGQWIGVNPGVHGYSGAADGLGPAVLPDLQPYAWSRLQVAAPELPLGYSLGPEAHTIRPTYRSGTVVRVGEEGSVLLRGVLHDETGAPLALSSGSVARVEERNEEKPGEPATFFTNRTGRFVLPALRPGSYLLRLDGQEGATRFSIPEDSVGVFELGTVALRTSSGKDVELVAKQVQLGRGSASPAPAIPGAAIATAALSTLRGRLYGDRNANGIADPDEPVFANVRVGAAGIAATTDAEGFFELTGLQGQEALLRVETPEALPFGMVPADKRIALGAPEVAADLLVPAARFPMAPAGAFTVSLPEGKVRAVQLEKATFPLAAWVAGLPLSKEESGRLGKLAERVHEGKDLRLLVVARAQSQGKLRGAVKRAFAGARALQRYLQATQLVPGKKLGLTVVEALPGFDSPLGLIELVLVRVEGPAAP